MRLAMLCVKVEKICLYLQPTKGISTLPCHDEQCMKCVRRVAVLSYVLPSAICQAIIRNVLFPSIVSNTLNKRCS